MRVLVTGGAGYIGSHTVLSLVESGHDVVVADDYSNAKPAVMDRLATLAGREIGIHVVDLTDAAATREVLAAERPDAVVHFAGYKAVGESVTHPLAYYRNNLGSTFSLLQAMSEQGVGRLVFSSSATVYGAAAGEETGPRDESIWPLASASPYGWTKVMIEQVIGDVARASGMKAALLRYFNPVGAHPSGDIGEDPQGIPNNLMPFIAQVAVGRRERLQVFGDDYPTPDGTCLRDYIHVQDLATGHVAALDHLDAMEEQVRPFNLGTGQGTSVLEMVAAFGRAVGEPIPYEITGRRAGDLAGYWADPTRAETELGWKATHGVDDMCADTWRWQQQNPYGYPDSQPGGA